MAYNDQSFKEIFWAESGNFVRGRDPLGIQNSSISVYANLLPGMTNLTLRLRYYGFYLWLLDEYLDLDPNHPFKENATGHYTFIRRAELILSFIMVKLFPEEQSVIGSNYVANHLHESEELGYFDIIHGADKIHESKDNQVYWKYPSGALGQYYAGSLSGLRLIDQRSGMFKRTDVKGKALAEAYKSSVDLSQRSLFLQRISEGKLYESDLEQLTQFVLNLAIDKKPEGQFYMKMFLDPDKDTTSIINEEVSAQRKETIGLFLNHLAKNESPWPLFPRVIYQSQIGENHQTEASFGWYCYQLNEFAHYYLETIFWGCLNEMDGKDYSLQSFLSKCSELVAAQVLPSESTQNSISKQLDLIDFETLENINSIDVLVKSNQHFEAMATSISGLLMLYKENRDILHKIDAYCTKYDVKNKHGNIIQIFQEYLIENLEGSVSTLIHRVIHKLLNEHIAIAYYKMGNGEKNLLKFILEDNHLVHIETMEPKFTNPRLRALFNFLNDLGLISKEGEVMEDGETLMHQLNKTA